MNYPGYRRRRRLTGEFFSPKYFLIRAIALIVLFLFVHLAGLREYTSFLSGTPASPNMDIRESSFYGTAYIIFYLGAVVLAPILALASGLLLGWQRIRERQRIKSADRIETRVASAPSQV